MDGGVGASFVFCSGDFIRPDGPLGSIIEETVFFYDSKLLFVLAPGYKT